MLFLSHKPNKMVHNQTYRNYPVLNTILTLEITPSCRITLVMPEIISNDLLILGDGSIDSDEYVQG